MEMIIKWYHRHRSTSTAAVMEHLIEKCYLLTHTFLIHFDIWLPIMLMLISNTSIVVVQWRRFRWWIKKRILCKCQRTEPWNISLTNRVNWHTPMRFLDRMYIDWNVITFAVPWASLALSQHWAKTNWCRTGQNTLYQYMTRNITVTTHVLGNFG